jgi:DUF1680 family protein
VIELQIEPERDVEFALRLRIPAWCRSASLAINGAPMALAPRMDLGYAHVKRPWKPGDVVKLMLPMPAERIYANPEVQADIGRVALKRGPIVYCLEGADNAAPMHRIALPRSSAIEARFRSDLLSGVGTLSAPAVSVRAWEAGQLYGTEAPGLVPIKLQAVPYSFWSNRESEDMSVWIREI